LQRMTCNLSHPIGSRLGTFAENDLQFKPFYRSSPDCRQPVESVCCDLFQCVQVSQCVIA